MMVPFGAMVCRPPLKSRAGMAALTRFRAILATSILSCFILSFFIIMEPE